MEKLFDIYEHKSERHVHYGIKASRSYDGRYYRFWIYKNEVVDQYRGEDSGAWYPEYSDDIVIESYDLTSILDCKIYGMTMKSYIDKMLDEWPPYAGKWYTPPSLHKLYSYLDSFIDMEKLKEPPLQI